MATLETNYALLSDTDETAGRITGDVLQLVSPLPRPEADGRIYQGEYRRTFGGLNFIVRPFVVDLDRVRRRHILDHSKFALGFSAILVDLIRDETTGFMPEPASQQTLETVTIEGGAIDRLVEDRLGMNRGTLVDELPTRFRALFGTGDVIDNTEPGFEPGIVAQELLQSFYRRYRIGNILHVVQQANKPIVGEVGKLVGGSYEYLEYDESEVPPEDAELLREAPEVWDYAE